MSNELGARVMMLVLVAAVGCDSSPATPGQGSDGSDAGAPPSDATSGETTGCVCPELVSGQTAKIAHLALSCLCDDGTDRRCGDILSTYDIATKCRGYSVIRQTGCGKVTYVQPIGGGGNWETFDAASGALVGTATYGDIGTTGLCAAISYVYGDVNESCGAVEGCYVCSFTGTDPLCP